MSRTGRTLTRTIEIEPRQHELFGLDLGEGPLRGQLVFGIAVFTLWLALTVPVSYLLGHGPSPRTALLFVAPPAAVVALGWRHAEDNVRRRRVTQWVLAIRYVLTGHEPVVTLGRHQARSDAVRLRDRVAARFGGGDLLAVAIPTRLHDGQHRGKPARPRGNPTVRLRVVARTYGTDHTARVVSRAGHRRGTRRRKEKKA